MKSNTKEASTPKINMASLFVGTIVAFNLFPLLLLGSKFPMLDNVWKSFITLFLVIYVLLKIGTKLKAPRSYILFLLIITGYQLLNPLINGDFPLNIRDLMSLSYLPLAFFLYFIALVRQKMNSTEVNKFLKYFVLFCVILCAYNLVINLSALKSLSTFTKPYDINFSSIFSNRNIFAFYLYTASASNVYLLRKDTRSNSLIATMVLLVTSLVLTLSRTSIIAFGVFVITYTFLAYGLRSLIKLIVPIAAASTLILKSDNARNLIETNLIRADAGLSGRDIAYSYAQKLLVNQDPIFGVGYFKSLEKLKIETGLSHFHNSYLTVYLYGGLSLTLMYFMAMGFGVLKSLSIFKHNKLLGSFLLAYIISYVAYSFTESIPLFGPAATNYIATVFVMLIPLYVTNGMMKEPARVYHEN